MARKSSFAESVINGTYGNDEEKKNTQQPIQTQQATKQPETTVKQPTIKSNFADSVINGTYGKTTTQPSSEPPKTIETKTTTQPTNDIKSQNVPIGATITPGSGYKAEFTNPLANIGNSLVNVGSRALNTAADVGLDFLEGGLGTIEGMVDWGSYRLADLSDVIGQEGWGEALRKNADFDSTGTWFGKNQNVQQNILGDWTSGIEDKSWSPDLVDNIFQGVGNVGALAATTALTGGGSLATVGATYTSGYGNARSAAKRNGASDRDANRAGIIGGFAEALSEQFFSGLPGLKVEGWGEGVNKFLSNKIGKYFGTNAGKATMIALDSLGEGAEEIISNAIQWVGNEFYEYGRQNQTKILDWDQFLSAALTSALLGTGKSVIDTKTQNKIINGYAQDNNMSFDEAKNQLTQMEPNQQQTQQPLEQTETPQIQQNQENSINNQPVMEQTQLDLNEPNNEVIQSNNSKENNNIPETKSEDVLKVTTKETSKNIADNLTKAIEGRNDSQNIKEIVRNVEQETGKKMRSWVETATTSTGNTELVNSMNKEKITYEPTSNKKNLDNANRELAGMSYEQKLEKAKALINGDKRLNSTDIAVLETVIQEAQKNGKMNDFMGLVQDTAILGTESGQVVQALSLIRQSDPTTQLSTLQKLIEKEQSKGNKVYDGVKIKEDLVENVLNSYNEDGTWNQENFDNAMYELKQDIVNQMNVRPTEKFTAWRYLSMLGNPKTHIRNIVANIAMNKLQGAKNKIASGIEAITPMNKLNKALGGNEQAAKGHTLRKSTQEVKNFADTTMENYFKENKQTSKYNDNVKGLKSELEQSRKIFKERTKIGEVLNWAEKKNSELLDIEDVKFNKSTAKKAFAEFLTANGIETQADIDANPDLVEQGKEYALFKGNEATFHQHSQTGTALRNFRESLRQGSNLSRAVGLGVDATIPFINTPINIAKTGIEYTPGIGLFKTISDVQKAPKNLKADVFVDSISKQFAGGMLAAVGFELAKLGILNGKSGEDKKDKLEKNLGKQGYSINLFGNTFDLSWLSPSAMPLFVGVETYNATKGSGVSPETIMNILTSTIDPLSEMSVISSVTEALQSYSKGTQAIGDIASSALTSYISQYFPTALGQVATVFDDTQRSSSGNTLGEKILNQVKYKIPGLRNTLPAQVDVWGEDKKNSENPVIRFAEAFLSPANRKEVKIDDTTKELERVYDNTGSGLPTLSLTKSPKIDTEYYNLSTDEYTQYKKDYGKNAKAMLDDLMKTDDYKKADDVEKSKMISAIYEYATYMAKKNYADDNNITFEYKKSNGKKGSYNYPKYYLSLSKDDFAKYVADKYADYTEKK